MIRNLEDKMLRDEDVARREDRMSRYAARVRQRYNIAGAAWTPSAHVELAAQPPCDVFRTDTTGPAE